MPSETTTLADSVRRRAAEDPDRPFVTFLKDGDRDEEVLTFAGLEQRALAVAGALLTRGLVPGDRVLVMLPSGLGFIETFFGIALAGMVAVPVYPPARLARVEHYLRTLASITETSACRAAVVDDRLVPLVGKHLSFKGQLLVTDVELRAAKSPAQAYRVEPRSPAFLQFTSGTTSQPRGVLILHHQLEAQLAAYCEALRLTRGEVVVSWLPLYHDLGLVGMVLSSLRQGAHLVLLSPTDFLKDPMCWLRAVSRHRGVHTAAPNFAYQLAVRKCPAERLKAEAIDLSSLDNAGLGGETVAWSTVERFRTHLAPFGLRPEVLNPCYGLAENTLVATGHRRGEPLRTVTVSARGLQTNALRPPEGDADRATIVGNGRPFPGMEVTTGPTPGVQAAGVGEIWVRSPSLAAGYFGDRLASDAVFVESGGARWLRTGDLGFVSDGDLYICGRQKDLMIVRGRNLHPQDLELEVGGVAGVRTGNVVAFSAPSKDGEGEVAVVVAELDPKAPRRLDDVRRDVVEAVSAAFQLALAEVVLLPSGSIPKTSSGKLQRGLVRQAWIDGELAGLAPPGAVSTRLLQARLGMASAWRRLWPGGARSLSREAPVEVGPEPAGEELDPRFAEALRKVRPDGEAPALGAALRVDGLGLDSLERVELWLHLARLYAAKVPDDAWSSSQTLGEVQALLEKHQGTAPAAAGPVDDGSSLLVKDLLAEPRDVLPPFSAPLTAAPTFGTFALTTRLLWGFEVEGREHLEREGGFVLAGNHATYLDGAWLRQAVTPAVRDRLLAYRFAGLPGFTGLFFAQMHTVPIDPERSFRQSIRAGLTGLAEGQVVLIFPEGLRTHSGRLVPFRPGVGLLSLLSQRPIVPFRSRGMFEVYPRDRALPRFLRRRGQPPIGVRFGAPIEPPPLEPERAWSQARELVGRLRAAVEAL